MLRIGIIGASGFTGAELLRIVARHPELHLELATADGPLRVYRLLHEARPALVNLGEPGGIDLGPWADRVQLVDAAYDGAWELPVLGEVPAPAAVLIRPDGHVGWVGDGGDEGLEEALTTWFGPRARS